jgi:hypothetical protein
LAWQIPTGIPASKLTVSNKQWGTFSSYALVCKTFPRARSFVLYETCLMPSEHDFYECMKWLFTKLKQPLCERVPILLLFRIACLKIVYPFSWQMSEDWIHLVLCGNRSTFLAPYGKRFCSYIRIYFAITRLGCRQGFSVISSFVT